MVGYVGGWYSGVDSFPESLIKIYQYQETTTTTAFATVNAVLNARSGMLQNPLDSFLFAEVLKHFHLTFTDPSIIDLGQWVFNTEAHPYLVPCGIGAADHASNSVPVAEL